MYLFETFAGLQAARIAASRDTETAIVRARFDRARRLTDEERLEVPEVGDEPTYGARFIENGYKRLRILYE